MNEDEGDVISGISEKLTLDEWLEVVRSGGRSPAFIDYRFLTNDHYNEFIEGIETRPDEDIKLLLSHFLIGSGFLGIDDMREEALLRAEEEDPDRFDRMMLHSYYRRLYAFSQGEDVQPWEGISWIQDLLPHDPKAALEGLHAYILAHAPLLSDGRVHSFYDALGIIRARFIGLPGRKLRGSQKERLQFLRRLDWREFEHVIEHLYHRMGYLTKLTQRSQDGGRDVECRRKDVGRKEYLVVECKQYSKNVGVAHARALRGVVADLKATKGVLATSGRFTRGALSFARNNPTVETIDGSEIVQLLNEYVGASWAQRIDIVIQESKHRWAAS